MLQPSKMLLSNENGNVDVVFEPSSVQSPQFQTLAHLTTMPAQHTRMNPID